METPDYFRDADYNHILNTWRIGDSMASAPALLTDTTFTSRPMHRRLAESSFLRDGDQPAICLDQKTMEAYRDRMKPIYCHLGKCETY